ncbi:hypothetical protein GCM10022247_36690 [Allokutzneria multivorans]|uniref:Uncharacterized protein n=1 Tax=Allokutzneria multivorans TaxID=1142134 RepID=A0ABP7SF86_9PSEU
MDESLGCVWWGALNDPFGALSALNGSFGALSALNGSFGAFKYHQNRATVLASALA